MNKKLFNDFPAVSAKEWKQKIQVDLKGADYNESLLYKSDDSVDVKPFYHQESTDKTSMATNPEKWEICEKVFLASEQAAIKHIVDILARGAESLWLIVPTEKTQLESVLKTIDLAQISVFIECLFLSSSFLKKTHSFLQQYPHQVAFGIDPIGHIAREGNWHKTEEADTQELEKIATETNTRPFLSIDASLYQNAGANIPQQIAYAVAHAHEYLHLLSKKSTLPAFNFIVAIGGNYFFEIAKLKALRSVFKAVSKAYGLPGEMKILTQSSKRNKTLFDYNVNMLRTTTENMSAVLGGADQVCPTAYDEIFHKQNEFGNRIARNQLLILKNESYFESNTNAAKGSYYLETLSTQFSEKALDIFKTIEKGGGFISQLKDGTIQRKIKESALKEQEKFDQDNKILVGTNKYLNPEDRMKNELELYPFLKRKPRKTIIQPILEKRLAENLEHERLEKE